MIDDDQGFGYAAKVLRERRLALAAAITDIRHAAAILDADPSEPIDVVTRAYWEGMARGMRLACSLALDELVHDG